MIEEEITYLNIFPNKYCVVMCKRLMQATAVHILVFFDKEIG